MRACLFSLFMLCLLWSGTSEAANRRAALIWDVKHNKVLHEAYATHKRYPASLTKMMTLYLTFEALEKGKLRLQQKMTASAHAAGQPATNLHMRKGQRISVEEAIVSLVVRSANDAAVVLAEAISGTEWQFAVDMTNKARRLGMKHTVFRNANGLPDKRQYTTARDMATLALALQQHFPQYYGYFKRTQFTYNGRTYTTHNRVLTQYEGADGIKTGYINASGFNLATSAKRDGHHIIGIVLGGNTAQERDRQMMKLMDNGFNTLYARYGKNPAYAAFVPKPVTRPQRDTAPQIVLASIPTPETRPSEIAAALEPSASAIPAPEEKPLQRQIAEPVAKPGILAHVAKKTGTVRKARSGVSEWGVQIGAYTEPKEALIAAAHAMTLASGELRDSRITIVPAGGNSIHRARLGNLTEGQAKAVCRKLRQQHEACFAVQL